MEGRNSIILNIWFAFITVYICFRHFLENDNFMYIIMDMIFLIIVLSMMYKTFRIKYLRWWGLFAILLLDMFFSCLYAMNLKNAIKFSVLYLNFWVIAVVFVQVKNWQKLFFKWIKAGCMVHLIFTFFSVFFKQRALQISERFLTDEAQRMTIRWIEENNHYAGLAGQTGRNAFFFIVLIGIFLSELYFLDGKGGFTKLLLFGSWIGLLLTGKKGFIIASVLSSIIVNWIMADKVKKRAMIVAICMLMSISFLGGIFWGVKIYTLFYNSIFTRMRLVEGMKNAIVKSPIWGNGVNSISEFTYGQHLGHNIYLQMWGEQGIIGLLILVIAILVTFFLTYGRARRIFLFNKINQKSIIFSLFFQVFIVVYGFFENSIYEYNSILIYFLAIAAGLADSFPQALPGIQQIKLKKGHLMLCSSETYKNNTTH